MNPSSLYLGDKIRYARKGADLTQRELADRLATNPSIPALWERDKRPVPLGRVQQLAEALEVDVLYLTDGRPLPVARPQIVPPRLLAYEIQCWSCSRSTYVRWTERRGLLEQQANTRRCDCCGSATFIVPADIGNHHAPAAATSAQYQPGLARSGWRAVSRSA